MKVLTPKQMNKKRDIFAGLFTLLLMGIIYFPFFLPEDVLYVNKCKQSYTTLLNVWGGISVYGMSALAAYGSMCVGRKIYDWCRK